MTDGGTGEGIFPVVVVKVNGVMCRALIDSGAGGSYASANLVTMIDEKSSETRLQRIDMLMDANEAGSRRRPTSVVKKLTREGNYERYDDIIIVSSGGHVTLRWGEKLACGLAYEYICMADFVVTSTRLEK
jgi:hypothetical protein